MQPFESILEKYRRDSFSEREKGYRFPYNQQFGGKDKGIDIVERLPMVEWG